MTSELSFDWDDENLKHLARRDVTRAEFEHVIVNDPILFDYKNIDGEDRWTGMGSTDMLRVLVVAFTIREGRIRAVTAITASKKRVRSSGSRNVIKMPIRRKKKEGLVVPRFTSRHEYVLRE